MRCDVKRGSGGRGRASGRRENVGDCIAVKAGKLHARKPGGERDAAVVLGPGEGSPKLGQLTMDFIERGMHGVGRIHRIDDVRLETVSPARDEALGSEGLAHVDDVPIEEVRDRFLSWWLREHEVDVIELREIHWPLKLAAEK